MRNALITTSELLERHYFMGSNLLEEIYKIHPISRHQELRWKYESLLISTWMNLCIE